MAWHSIQEAQQLTGKSRRTLYRDMSKGRLSWAPGSDNVRRLETSELIRAYGALLPMAQPKPEQTAHIDTGVGTLETALIMAELKALRAEVGELRQAMRLIEHKPESVPSGTPETLKTMAKPKLLPWWRRPIFSRTDQ